MLDQRPARSHLFTIRLWRENLSEELSEVRFRVQHVLSGETRHFREESDVMGYLWEKLRELENAKLQSGARGGDD